MQIYILQYTDRDALDADLVKTGLATFSDLDPGSIDVDVKVPVEVGGQVHEIKTETRQLSAADINAKPDLENEAATINYKIDKNTALTAPMTHKLEKVRVEDDRRATYQVFKFNDKEYRVRTGGKQMVRTALAKTHGVKIDDFHQGPDTGFKLVQTPHVEDKDGNRISDPKHVDGYFVFCEVQDDKYKLPLKILDPTKLTIDWTKQHGKAKQANQYWLNNFVRE